MPTQDHRRSKKRRTHEKATSNQGARNQVLSDQPDEDRERKSGDGNYAVDNTDDRDSLETWLVVKIEIIGLLLSQSIPGERYANIEEAIVCCQEVLTQCDTRKKPYYWALANMYLGIAYRNSTHGQSSNNIKLALTCMKRSLKVFNLKKYPLEWARVMSNLGNVYSNVQEGIYNSREMAINCYEKALQVFTPRSHADDWAMTLFNLGGEYILYKDGNRKDNLDRALVCYREAAEYFEPTQLYQHIAIYSYTTIGKLYLGRSSFTANSDYQLAEEYLHKAKVLLEKIMENNTNDENGLTNRHLAAFGETLFVREAGIELQSVLCRLAMGAAHWTEALLNCQKGMELSLSNLLAAYTSQGHRFAARAYNLFCQNAAYCLLKLKRIDEAVLHMEFGRARRLAEAFAAPKKATSTTSPFEAANKTHSFSDRLYEQDMQPEDKPTIFNVLLSSGREARFDQKAYLRQLHSVETDTEWIEASIHDVLDAIPKNTVLVTLLCTSFGGAVVVVPCGTSILDETNVIWLPELTNDAVTALVVGDADKPGWTLAYQGFLKHRNMEGFSAILDQLTSQLWDAVIGRIYEKLESLGIQHVIMVPTKGLQLLPLHAAWRGIGSKRLYLLDKYTVSYAPSIAFLRIAKRRADRATPVTAFVGGVSNHRQAATLEHVQTEVDEIAQLLGTTPVLNKKLTTQKFIMAASKSRYVHLACHASYVGVNDPLDATLYLHGNSKLQLSEILEQLKLKEARIVTLSACETGVVDVQVASDEFVGLPFGFLLAGAPAVIGSLWAVDDYATALLMIEFYRNHITKGMEPADALRSAQIWLRDRTVSDLQDYYRSQLRISPQGAFQAYSQLVSRRRSDQPYSNPFFWAAFTMTGV